VILAVGLDDFRDQVLRRLAAEMKLAAFLGLPWPQGPAKDDAVAGFEEHLRRAAGIALILRRGVLSPTLPSRRVPGEPARRRGYGRENNDGPTKLTV
jgi:hypothetical protein